MKEVWSKIIKSSGLGFEEINHAFKIVRQSLGFPSSSVVENLPAMQVIWV